MSIADETNTLGKKSTKFQKGNSFGKGREIGSRSKALIALDQMGYERAATLKQMQVDAALGGDLETGKWLLEFILSKPKSRTINMMFPIIKDLAGVSEAQDYVLQKIGEGEISLDEGERLSVLIDNRRKTIETCEIMALVMDTQKRLKDAGL